MEAALSAERILRVASLSEQPDIAPAHCATYADSALILSDGSAYPAADPFVPGEFVLLYEAGNQRRVKRMPANDIPERALFLTDMCNSNCVMCPYTEKRRFTGGHESIEVLNRFVHLMSPYSPYLCITGGEPTLLGRDFLSLMETVRTHFYDCLVHILTNGRAFAYPDFVRAFQGARTSRTLLGIPIYGHDAALHDSITRTPDSFNQTVSGLKRLYATGEHIEIRIVVSGLNYLYLDSIAEFICAYFPNVYCVSIMGIEMMGSAMAKRDRVWISFDEAMPRVSRATDILLERGVQAQLYNFPLCKINKRHWPVYRRSITPSKVRFPDECAPCGARDKCGGFFLTTACMPGLSVAPMRMEDS